MKLGKISGITISLHYSTLVIMFLVGFSSASFYAQINPQASIVELIIYGTLGGLLILFSIIVHELTHSLTSQKYGIDVSEIEFYLFGGVSKITKEPETPKQEMVISVVGPLSSLILAAILIGFSYIPLLTSEFVITFTWYFGYANLILGIFNLVPGYPMDGGRILRAYLWKKRDNIVSATETASKVGSYIGSFMMGIGFLTIFLFLNFGGLWYILLGNFLRNSAQQGLVQTIVLDKLDQMTIEDISRPINVRIESDKSVMEAIRNYFMNHKLDYFPVWNDTEKKYVGIIGMKDIKKLSRQERAKLKVSDVMKNVSEMHNVKRNANSRDAFEELVSNKSPYIAVEDENGVVINFVSPEDFQLALSFSQLDFDDSNYIEQFVEQRA